MFQLWNFFLYSSLIFLFWSDDIVFSFLTKNALKIFKLEKEFKILKISCPKYDFMTKNSFNFFSMNDLYTKITFPCLL